MQLGLDIVRDSWVVALCAHLYYHGDQSVESPLTDEENDALINAICNDWGGIPEELKKLFVSPDTIQASTNHVRLTQEQLAKAWEEYRR